MNLRDEETGRCTCCGRLGECACTGAPDCCPEPSPVPILMAALAGAQQASARRRRGR